MALKTHAAGSGGAPALLTSDDPSPVQIVNPHGPSSFLLLGDHAGNAIPASLDKLGLSDADLARHIAYDIGVGELGLLLANSLDAVFIRQTYSRLVIDCNRHPGAPDSIASTSDGIVVPGNQSLSPADQLSREASIHAPYHEEIRAEIGRRDRLGMRTILIALHSFTPVMDGLERPWHIGILYDGSDTRFARVLLERLQTSHFCVEANEPYQMDATDYTVPRHAYDADLPYAEIEVRQNVLSTAESRLAISDALTTALLSALGSFG